MRPWGVSCRPSSEAFSLPSGQNPPCATLARKRVFKCLTTDSTLEAHTEMQPACYCVSCFGQTCHGGHMPYSLSCLCLKQCGPGYPVDPSREKPLGALQLFVQTLQRHLLAVRSKQVACAILTGPQRRVPTPDNRQRPEVPTQHYNRSESQP